MSAKQSATLFDGTEDETAVRGSTPLMRQYYSIKEKHPNTVLLFRMGDFYETFDEDARLVAPILGLTLTKRANGKAEDVALAGFPHHALDSYLPKLVRTGHRVAICEQVEDPKTAKTIVRREVVEVVSPGVSFRDELLNPRRANYLCALVFASNRQTAGLAFVDASTGEFFAAEIDAAELERVLDGIAPTELLLSEKQSLDRIPTEQTGTLVTSLPDWLFGFDMAQSALTDHFRTHSLKGFGLDNLPLATRAAGAVIQYVRESQNGRIPQIRSLKRYQTETFMLLDPATRRNLDLEHEVDTGKSVVAILDRTRTPMGARRLRAWIFRPLVDEGQINARLDGVAEFIRKDRRRSVSTALEAIGDIERLVVRNATGRSTPRDLSALASSLRAAREIPALLKDARAHIVRETAAGIDPCDEVVDLIEAAIVAEPPASLGSGVTFRNGFSAELDEARSLSSSGKEHIARIQKAESGRSGIPSLKVGYNKVFGYYLEVTNAHKDKVPDYFIRKQTLVNAERYITPELKELEEKILRAQETIEGLERELFDKIRTEVAAHEERALSVADSIATIDTLCAFATASEAGRFVRPVVDSGSVLDIQGGRHPVVEASLEPGEQFIPNSVTIDPETEQILVITGPNMAGKSVVLRQTGLIVLLAQVGCYVPAERARVGVVDRIFTRVGASDNLSAGESTFLVEMNEAANILNNATPRSLILLDEVGRGTSTFDGLSIAWSLVEYLHEHGPVRAKTMFATHYHELNELASRLERVANYRVLVEEHAGRVVFLRKLVRGGADHSYGIEVARMAGLPEPVVSRAREILFHLEKSSLVEDAPQAGDGATRPVRVGAPMSHPDQSAGRDTLGPVARDIIEKIARVDVNTLTPVQALVLLSELSSIAKTYHDS